MDKRTYLNLIYDYYGELLTEHQRRVFEMYYHDDLSLTEIGESNGTSKQAVSDLLRRIEKRLHHYEEKLRLAENELPGTGE